ncbi:MAG: amino acid--[acyl-carrier-protein] ligase [Bryobacteraceae bacterium]
MTTAARTIAGQDFLEELISSGHLLPSGEPGLYGRGPVFEDVRNRVDALITSFSAADHPETPRFPPVMPRRTLEQCGYLKSFPNLCGSVFSFDGSDAEARDLAKRAGRHQDWSEYLSRTNVAMVPAACYPAYPAIARRGPLPPCGATLDLGGCYVFRNEPSSDPARLQMFHQRELVRIGETEDVLAWRETWMSRAKEIFESAGLHPRIEAASDAFFGHGGKLLAKSQREQRLKFELLVRISSDQPGAAASFNFHQDHFGSAFGIRLHDGGIANSACTGFGLERIALALFREHGMTPRDWPAQVRARLWPDGLVSGS